MSLYRCISFWDFSIWLRRGSGDPYDPPLDPPLRLYPRLRLLTKWFYNVEYNEGDKINCCIMEVRQDGTATVSLSPDLLEAALKLKKKKKKSSTRDSRTFSKHRKLQLAEVSHHCSEGFIVTTTTCMLQLQLGNAVMVHVELVTSHYIMGTCTLLSGHMIVYGLFDTVTYSQLCVCVCVCVCV